MSIHEQDFCHLHVHTDKSLLDGVATPEDLVRKAKSLGHRYLAITDHGNLHNVVHFYEKCKEEGIKPILGVEFYFEEEWSSGKDKKRFY